MYRLPSRLPLHRPSFNNLFSFHRNATASPLRSSSPLVDSQQQTKNDSMPPVPENLLKPMEIPARELFGPGPSNMTLPIQDSASRSLLGHLHPEFIKIMSDAREGLQYVFKTQSAYTFAVSGTGHAGMEAAVLNLLERGEKILALKTGIWGQRCANLAKRLDLQVQTVEAVEGNAVPFDEVKKAIESFKPQVLFVCQGESSTGVCQPIDGLGELCHQNNCLLLVDTVASLGGTEFDMDAWGVDCVYSATQKVLNAPPGLAPISFSQRAMDKIKTRKTPVASWYFDALELGNYWGADEGPKRYHHTAPISTVYTLRTALAEIAKEGIDAVIARHRKNSEIVYGELEAINLKPFVEKKEWRLPCLTTISVPDGVDAAEVQKEMMAQGIEIAGGLGPTAGRIWRIGTFGANSNEEKIRHVIKKLGEIVQTKRSRL
ncbi:unnamed protein product, partial [Mesorhabditis belari]|uniref:Alanine--glyoxylate aminotransferase n=1 Tax=Mesorhabditis belari TaxID=2138241 RepID=A0AAF3J6U7_9BILA